MRKNLNTKFFTSNAVFLIFFAAFAGSLSGVIAKGVFDGVGPFTVVFFRFLISGLIFLPFFYKYLNLKTFKNVYKPALISAANGVMFFAILPHIPISVVPIYYSSVSAVTAIILWLTKGKKIQPITSLGLVLAFLGVFIAAIETVDTFTYSHGLIAMIFPVILVGMLGIVSKEVLEETDLSPMVLVFFMSVCGLVLALPFMFNEIITGAAITDEFKTSHILGVVFIALGVQIGQYLAYYKAMETASPIVVGLFTNLQVVIVFVLAAIILSEPITWLKILGGAVVLTGAYLVNSKKYDNSVT